MNRTRTLCILFTDSIRTVFVHPRLLVARCMQRVHREGVAKTKRSAREATSARSCRTRTPRRPARATSTSTRPRHPTTRATAAPAAGARRQCRSPWTSSPQEPATQAHSSRYSCPTSSTPRSPLTQCALRNHTVLVLFIIWCFDVAAALYFEHLVKEIRRLLQRVAVSTVFDCVCSSSGILRTGALCRRRTSWC